MIEERDGLPALPRGWLWTNVGQIFEILGGGTPSTKVKEYWNGDIPWITSADIHGLRDIRPQRFVTEEGVANSATNLIPEQSIVVVTRVGLGKLALADKPLCFSQDSQALVRSKSLIHPEYALYYLSMAVRIFKYTHRGTTIGGVTKKQLHELPLPLAPLGEQKRVVARLEELLTRLDAGVEGLQKVKAQLKRYRQAVLKYAFEGKLTEEWRKTHKDQIEPATELLDQIKQGRKEDPKYREPPPIDESDLPKIPKNWKWTTIATLFEVGSGGTPSRRKPEYWAGNIPWVSSGEVAFCEIWSTNEYITKEGLENTSAKLYPEGTVLMALYGEGKTRGQVAILRTTAATNQAIACIRCANSPVPSQYVYWWLRYRYYETRRIREGANQPNMYLHHVRKMTVPIAPLSEQKEIIEKIEKSLSVADEIDRTVDTSLLQATRLRQRVLKIAFEGKLVAQDPNDEPAERLLERIGAEREESKDKRGTNKRKRKKPRRLELFGYVE